VTNLRAKIVRAAGRISRDIRRTPLEFSPHFSRMTGREVYVKWENEQDTGSFKFRGALNKVRSLGPEERQSGAVTASTGNHGLGVSLAARMENVDLTLVLPLHVSAGKRKRLEESGAKIFDFGQTCEQAEIYARRLALESGRVYISPYNDEEVIAGQGTIATEIAEDFPGADTIIVPVGGGGLVSGIAAYLKAGRRTVRVYGVEPENSAFLAASLAAGKIVEVDERETIADAVAGGIEPGSITFPLCQEFLDGILTVGESAIREAMSLLLERHGRMIEGAGALPLAALLSSKAQIEGQKVVLVVSGGNITPEAFAQAVGELS
jgi:threonine dehydratase